MHRLVEDSVVTCFELRLDCSEFGKFKKGGWNAEFLAKYKTLERFLTEYAKPKIAETLSYKSTSHVPLEYFLENEISIFKKMKHLNSNPFVI